MRILAIETSCDETSIAILEVENEQNLAFSVLAHETATQIDIHKEFGGVFPALARREHGKNIPVVFEKAMSDAGLWNKSSEKTNTKDVTEILTREQELIPFFKNELAYISSLGVDAIAVTYGPGLEPALWVGVNFAKALAYFFDLPLVPVNHMEGHVLSVLLQEELRAIKNEKVQSTKYRIPEIQLPAIALLISGGHTELVLVKDFLKYEIIGKTRDDAVGEAFDKVARMLGLPYPGGPEISKFASIARISLQSTSSNAPPVSLPRPMIHSKDFDFSFSGLKTAVLYFIRDLKEKNPEVLEDNMIKQSIAQEFEDAVTEVLVKKTMTALQEFGAQTLIVGGGVAANKHITSSLITSAQKINPDIKTYIPQKELTTDNALMIAIVGYFRFTAGEYKKDLSDLNTIRAEGNLKL
jgi:N6-L-threonylcarbamoyladenine synthase